MRRDTTGKPPRRTAVALTRLGMLTAAAFVLSWLELLIPLPVRMPGVKLGLCHIAVLFALYRMGWREAAFVSLIRALLAALLFGRPWHSVCAAVRSVLLPCCCYAGQVGFPCWE